MDTQGTANGNFQPQVKTGKAIIAIRWLAFYAAIAAAWVFVFAMARQLPGAGEAGFSNPGFWDSVCLATARTSPLALFFMWGLMSAAMMTPTFVPALAVFDQLGACGATDLKGFAAITGGYLAIWLIFSAAGASAQYFLARHSLVAPDGASRSLWLTGGLLAFAGLYQFSRLKNACLDQCRQPLTFFMQYWRPGALAAFSMGARLGAYCLGCCWALMALGFAGGTMNPVWMGLATLFMIFEKLPDLGRIATRPAGIALLIAAGLVFGRALAFM